MLREYQKKSIDLIRESIRSDKRAPLLVAPTGSGKSVICSHIVSGATAKGKRVLFLAPRRELIYQISNHFKAVNVDHGVIMAGEEASFLPDTQIACIPSLYRRVNSGRVQLPPADIVVVDEAHIGTNGQSQKILFDYKDRGAVILGLTATPCRTDGYGLGGVYDDLIIGPSVKELTGKGWLVPARYFTGERPDMSGVKITAGDYNQKQAGERADSVKLVGDIVENWLRICPDRKTFVFAASVAHSMHLAEQFQRANVKAEHLDGETNLEERKEIQQRLRSGETQVIVNCMVMTYGVDFPDVSCVVLASPTKSIVKYLQQVGRGLRPAEGKKDLIVLDHIGAVMNENLGFVDDDRFWTLDGKTKVDEKIPSEKKPLKEIECSSCHTIFRAAKVCPNCGKEMGGEYAKAVQYHEAMLKEIERNEMLKGKNYTMAEKADFFGQLKTYAYKHQYSQGWCAHKYKEKFGVWPNHPSIKEAPKMPITDYVSKWLAYQRIKWAKSKYNSRNETHAR